MKKETNFILLQASIVFNAQLSFFSENYEDSKQGRNMAFRDLIFKLEDKKIIKVSPRVTEYILLYKAALSDNIIYCQLAKKTQMETYSLTGNKIEMMPIESYPPLNVFINLSKQQFAVEMNTSIMNEETVESTIKKLFSSLTKSFSVFINVVQDRKGFWELIDNDDDIKEIQFDLIAPNFLDATGAANELVNSAKMGLNADSVNLTFKNKHGKLSAKMSYIDSFVKYSSSAGSWKLKIKRKGETRYKVYSSADFCVKTKIEEEILELLNSMESFGNVGNDKFEKFIDKIDGLFKYEADN